MVEMRTGAFFTACLLVSLFSVTLGSVVTPVVAVSSTIMVLEDYPTIQAAVNAASPGDTILVASGTYYEHVVVNKSLTLVGENSSTTIVNGSASGIVFHVTANNVSISNLCIWNGKDFQYCHGVYLNNTFGNYVSNNRIFAFFGVEVYKGSHNTIVNNIIDMTEEIYVLNNIVINNSSDNIVFGNKLWAYDSSVDLIRGSCHNYIYDNNMWAWALTLAFGYSNKNYVTGNVIGVWTSGIYLIHSCNNTFYHNSFIETLTGLSLYIDGYSLNNTWDNGYPSGGNYWSDYAGVDYYTGPYQNETGSDRIGDTPYVIDVNNQDRYPLMHPWFELPKIDYELHTLNLWGEDGWFTSHIELPIGYEVSKVNASTILLNDTIPIDPEGNVTVGDYDKDGVPDLTVQFNRTKVVRYIRDVQKIRYGNVKLTVAGELFDGPSFEGTGLITVRMAGDVNCDGVIDVYDLTAWANAFGSQPGYPNWNPLADLNQDEIVDIFDGVIVAINYGKTWR